VKLDVKDVAAKLSEAKGKLLRAQDESAGRAKAGGEQRCGEGAGDLAKAQGSADGCERITKGCAADQAASRDEDELAANDLALTKAQAKVTRWRRRNRSLTGAWKLDTDQAALHVQQIENEVAAFDEKVRQGRITHRRMERCTRCQ